ncbi:MAG: M23 family metallopeptidase, partial [Candidatus Moranbacteria bacterium]|nr:M23 family metallopeptidase [Candidatus Moranbacteria bacterium]
MKKIYLFLAFLFLAVAAFFYFRSPTSKNTPPPAVSVPVPAVENKVQSVNTSVTKPFSAPLANAGKRITKKPFGIFITPKNSPVQPEKFQGYHTGTDFEIFLEELNMEVPVSAVCSGKLALKKYASDYGGVVVESCDLNNQPVTVIYGHLKLASITSNIGNNLNAGDKLGILGADKSAETGGERKHLHLGIH